MSLPRTSSTLILKVEMHRLGAPTCSSSVSSQSWQSSKSTRSCPELVVTSGEKKWLTHGKSPGTEFCIVWVLYPQPPTPSTTRTQYSKEHEWGHPYLHAYLHGENDPQTGNRSIISGNVMGAYEWPVLWRRRRKGWCPVKQESGKYSSFSKTPNVHPPWKQGPHWPRWLWLSTFSCHSDPSKGHLGFWGISHKPNDFHGREFCYTKRVST